MVLLDSVTETPYGVVLAALNVLQTIALAYLAASTRAGRNGTTKKDPGG